MPNETHRASARYKNSPFFSSLLSDYGLTKVVTLEAGRVAVNALPPTVILVCCAKSRLDEVTQGVTEVAVKPFNAKFSTMFDPLWLMATIANFPVLGSL